MRVNQWVRAENQDIAAGDTVRVTVTKGGYWIDEIVCRAVRAGKKVTVESSRFDGLRAFARKNVVKVTLQDCSKEAEMIGAL